MVHMSAATTDYTAYLEAILAQVDAALHAHELESLAIADAATARALAKMAQLFGEEATDDDG